MHDAKLYMAVLAASLFGVSMPVFTSRGNEATRHEADDALLAQRVRQRLRADSRLRGQCIQVRCQAGEIFLGGQVDEAGRAHAEQLASKTPGVVDVHNLLTVVALAH